MVIMKYFIYIFLGVSSFVWAAEGDENKHPNIINKTNSVMLRELEVKRNCYKSFVEMYSTEITALAEHEFFKKKIDDHNELVMRILDNLFLNKGESEHEIIHPIISELKNCPNAFKNDMKKLNDLVKARGDEHNPEVKELLEDMKNSFGITQLMILYYWKNQSWFYSLR